MDRRIKIVFILFCAWFLVITGRLWDMQVLQKTRYKEMSVRNRIRLVRLPSARGRIYDRNGKLLVDNKAATQLVVILDEVKNKQELAEELSAITKVSPEYILKKIKEYMFKPFIPAVLASDLSPEILTNVAESKWRMPGASIQIAPIRDYLLGETLSHIVGYIGEAGEKDLDSGSLCGDIVGRIGIEKQFDKQLRGEPGYREVQVDYRGNIDAILNIVEPKMGTSFFLTIDYILQEELYNAMRGHRGAGIAMDPETGEILAIVSSPGFNPDDLVSPVKEEVVTSLFMDKNRPMLNRAVSGLYAPGSVFKIIVSLAALEKGVVSKKSLFYCDGEFQLGDAKFKCWDKKGHGWMDLTNALKKSCNEYFYQAGLKTGRHAVIDMAARFGLGRATGIGLPGEKAGFLPPDPDKKYKWSSGDTVNLSIGHGKILVTPIQMACLISAVANGGILYKPKIILEEPVQGSPVDIEKQYLDLVKEGLYRVMNEPDGTGHSVCVEGLDMAGKTGTVELFENRKRRDICWFAGFATLRENSANVEDLSAEPQAVSGGQQSIVVVVVTEEGESGGATSGPIAKRVFEKWKKIKEDEHS